MIRRYRAAAVVAVRLCILTSATAAASAAPAAAQPLPTLVQHVASSANPVGLGIPGNAFKIPLPNAVGAGNCLILGISYEWSGTRTVAITDDNGNTWPGAAVTANPGGGVISAIHVLPDANAGPTTITVTFDAPVIPFQYTVSEFYNVATVSPVNGTSATAADAGPALATGSFTPGNNDANGGNLIWSYFALAHAASGNPSLWTPGASFTLLDADIAWNTNQGYPHASEYSVQSTSAATNPGITATGDTDGFNALSVALKAAAAGTAPPAGIRIVRVVHMTSNVPPASGAWKLQVPTVGNLIVLSMNENTPVIDVTGITDSNGNAYTRREPTIDAPQIWHTADSTPSTNLTVNLEIAGTPATATVVAYDIVGAAASPFDVVAGVPTTSFDNQTHITNAPSITPTTTNGLVIANVVMGQGPVTGLDTGAPPGAFFDLVTYAGEVDLDLMENADGKAHVYNTDLATQHWNWVGFSAPSNSYAATAVAFKGAAGGQDLIFKDGFESGDLSRWSSAVTDGSDLTVGGAGALCGTVQGLQGAVDDTHALYVQDDTPNGEGRYRVRFYFDPNGFDPGEASLHFRTRMLIAFDPSMRRALTLVLRRLSGAYSVETRVRRNDGTRADTGFVAVSDGPHFVEVDWRRATAPGASDGSLQMWIDGALVRTLGGIDNDLNPIDFVRLGALAAKVGAAGTLYYDQFESRRATYIGPGSPASFDAPPTDARARARDR